MSAADLSIALTQIDSRLVGRSISDVEASHLRKNLAMPEWLIEAMKEHRLVGTTFVLDETADKSGLGTELLWLSPCQMVSEACESQPGIAARAHGLLPFGACAIGSGDYYYLAITDEDDPPVRRVPHDIVLPSGSVDLSRIEPVVDHLHLLLTHAAIE